MCRLCKALPQNGHCSPSKCSPGNIRVGEGRVADGKVWRVTLVKENKKPPTSSALFWSLSWSGWLPLSVSPPFSLQHYFWQCILSPSRWLQLGWHHLLLLFHLLALAGAVGKTNLQGLSAPSSITICQTCKKKKGPRQRKCW